MRILHLIHSEGVYGAELILLYLAREQQRGGHQVAVGSMRDPGTPQTQFEGLAATYGVTIVPLRIPPRPTPSVRGTLLGCARELRAQVIHSHGYKSNILLGLVPGGDRPPTVATLHGWASGHGLSRLRLYEALDRLAIRRLDATVVVARNMLDLPALRRLTPPRKHLIENGIPPLNSRLSDLGRQGIPEPPQSLQDFVRRAPTLVAIGRLSQEKNFSQLIDSFAAARAHSASPYQLLIIGDGPEREALAQRIGGLPFPGSVLLGGYLAGADRLLQDAAGFVMSSLTEGMPLVLMEALQWRVPILATSVGAIPDLLKDGAGRLVPPGNGPALTAALGELMRAPAAVRPAVTEDLARRYSSARMAQQYLDLYEQIA
jgi:glycosyltransferase involved in cell wall biosynthesis